MDLGHIAEGTIEVTEGAGYKLVSTTRPSKPTNFSREYEDAIRVGFNNNGIFHAVQVISRTDAKLLRDLLTETLEEN